MASELGIAVHPRVGGEHAPQAAAPRRSRMRVRFIPAWAGNTMGASRILSSSSVHPRVGGEHLLAGALKIAGNGSSPRGRGTHGADVRRVCAQRFIPAWAGNTSRVTLAMPKSPVHPRVGGEHSPVPLMMASSVGSSPRGRGTPVNRRADVTPGRFIPAWAGNTTRYFSRYRTEAVHPRVGGEHPMESGLPVPPAGSSPRGRGTQGDGRQAPGPPRFIPAWAGNTNAFIWVVGSHPVHPRVGGEHQERIEVVDGADGSSPRGRGTRRRARARSGPERFIPAWAGNT